MTRITIGNFPPLATAVLKVFFYSNLDIEDLSYCLRIPTAYIPKYFGDMTKFLKTGGLFKG